MPITVKLPSGITTGSGLEELTLEGATPEQLMTQVAGKYPEIRQYFFNSSGQLRESLAFFKDNTQVDTQESLPDGAVLEIMHGISGGSAWTTDLL